MVKAELTIEFSKEDKLHIGLDLLRREDATEEEFQVAQSIQESLLIMIDLLKGSGLAKVTKREIIKDKTPFEFSPTESLSTVVNTTRNEKRIADDKKI